MRTLNTYVLPVGVYYAGNCGSLLCILGLWSPPYFDFEVTYSGTTRTELYDTTNRNVPTSIDCATGCTTDDAGYWHSLGIKAGELYTWGYNNDGQLGDGTTVEEWAST
jgi:hypothetical protein